MNTPTKSVPFHAYRDNGLADYIFNSRYSCYSPELGRRETYLEAVLRVERMHREQLAPMLPRRIAPRSGGIPVDPADRSLLEQLLGGATLNHVIAQAFAAVATKRILPSMRSLQFGGEAIRRHPARMFNCAFSPVDRIGFFREYFYLLLAGTGCGFSVQHVHVRLLPALPPRTHPPAPPTRHVITDSIEGWADALHRLVAAHFAGQQVEFDYSAIRPAGTPPVASDGRAPGSAPLRRALDEVAAILTAAAGRQLKPVEIYDLCMFVARAVLSGGMRRAASICLFSADDEEMLNAKTGSWLKTHPHRSASNNSAVFLRATADKSRFRHVLETLKSHGEPGFYFTDDLDYGCNPCGEAGLHPVVAGPLPDEEVTRLRAAGYAGPLPPAARLSGWQMCNLSTINGAAVHRAEHLLVAAVHAAVIGTLQATYTNIAYLGPITRYLNERDALLGVSLCGFMDNPGTLLSPSLLERAARLCRAANQMVAAALGIRPAARVTCVKPEGSVSMLLGTGAGIHPHHATRYFRRLQADRRDPVYQCFHAANPEMTEPSASHPDTDDCITFPVEAPASACLREHMSAVDLLQCVVLVQKRWVLAGENPGSRSPGLHHNVSHTCPVREGEWDAVADYIWQHRTDISGTTLFSEDAARHYPQPPWSVAATPEDAVRWNNLACRHVDYATVEEPRHNPDLVPVNCGTDACETSSNWRTK